MVGNIAAFYEIAADLAMVLSLPALILEAYLQWETLLFERGVYNPCPMSFDLTEA